MAVIFDIGVTFCAICHQHTLRDMSHSTTAFPSNRSLPTIAAAECITCVRVQACHQHPINLNCQLLGSIVFSSDAPQPYGDSSANQAGQQYPSPYQARYRLHSSKHSNRGYKRRANASAGGDGGSSAFGGGGSGVALGLASTSSHARGRTERDRFLVDINNGGQRSGGTAKPLLQARNNVGSVWHTPCSSLIPRLCLRLEPHAISKAVKPWHIPH